MVEALFSSSKDAFLLSSLKGNFLKLMWKASRGIVQELVRVLLLIGGGGLQQQIMTD